MSDKTIIFSLGSIRNVKLANTDFRRAYVTGAKTIAARDYTIFIPSKKNRLLPGALTWNSQLHEGVENLHIIFSSPAGKYLLTLVTVENHVRRIRKGKNLIWDGQTKIHHGGIGIKKKKSDKKFDLPDTILTRFEKEIDNQIKAKNPDRSPIDFWLIDEIANQPHSNIFTVTVDGREFGMFIEHFPKHVSAGPDKFRSRTISIPLIIEYNGIHTLTIKPYMIRNPKFPYAPWGRCASTRLILAGIQFSKNSQQTRRLPLHPLIRAGTREYPTDFNGWEFPLFYQRYDSEGADLDYFRRVCSESFYRGGNFVSVYMTDCNKTINQAYAGIIPWPDELNLPGREEYNHNNQTGWDQEKLKELIHISQSSGLLACWYTHLPHIQDHWESLSWPWMKNYTLTILHQFADLSMTPEKRLQGLIYETAGFANDIDMLLFNELFWQINPLMFFGESENERLRTTAGTAPLRIEYHATTDFAWEDKFPDDSQLDPRCSESQYGVCSYFGQMNCRDRKYSLLYGEIGPDAIVKQVNDTVRTYNIDKKLPGRLTGFEWILESPEATSQRNREMVYAVSCDPVCGSLAYEAETYGRGGRMDQTARRMEDSFYYRQRYDHDIPHTAVHLQNNYCRLSVWPGSDGGLLQLDTSATAHFDSNGPNVCLSKQFLAASIIGSTKVASKDITIKHRGPYLAEVAENLQLLTNEPVETSLRTLAEINERRRYQMISDMPMLHVEIVRHFIGAEPETQNFIPLTGYDEIRISGKWYHKSIASFSWNFKAQTLFLRDSRKLLPDMAIVIKPDKISGRAPTRLRWKSNYGLGLWWDNPKKHRLGVGNKQIHPLVTANQSIVLDFVMLGALYKTKDIKYLDKLWDKCFAESSGNRTTVKNKFNLPLVKVVKLPSRTKLPFLIKENEVWHFRGAQPADKNNDFVKCYLAPSSSAIIRRWGYINNLVKTAPGSQYAVNIRHVKTTASGCTLRVGVSGVSPTVNPSLDFISPIAAAKVNGRSWHVYDSKRLYLPKAPGSYRVEVTFGSSSQPHIIATQAHIKKTQTTYSLFSFDARLPQYSFKLAPSIHFYAAVRIPKACRVKVTNGKLVETRNNIVIVKFKPSKNTDTCVTISF